MIPHHVQYAAVKNMGAPDLEESRECIKLIRKLRWIGLDDEASRLQEAVRTFAPDGRDTVVAESVSTD